MTEMNGQHFFSQFYLFIRFAPSALLLCSPYFCRTLMLHNEQFGFAKALMSTPNNQTLIELKTNTQQIQLICDNDFIITAREENEREKKHNK